MENAKVYLIATLAILLVTALIVGIVVIFKFIIPLLTIGAFLGLAYGIYMLKTNTKKTE